jgi:hypothetical protein
MNKEAVLDLLKYYDGACKVKNDAGIISADAMMSLSSNDAKWAVREYKKWIEVKLAADIAKLEKYAADIDKDSKYI